MFTKIICYLFQFELIDTLWNVNVFESGFGIFAKRINRYIMECKLYTFNNDFPVAFNELIDTLWNVNYVRKRRKICVSTELIDTLWNVNFIGTGSLPL